MPEEFRAGIERRCRPALERQRSFAYLGRPAA
jgi:hypothetical protein